MTIANDCLRNGTSVHRVNSAAIAVPLIAVRPRDVVYTRAPRRGPAGAAQTGPPPFDRTEPRSYSGGRKSSSSSSPSSAWYSTAFCAFSMMKSLLPLGALAATPGLDGLPLPA